MSQKQTGFTIIELLIVIVVIGVLAAITLIGYSGIQTKAENTKTINSAAAYTKALQAYAARNGTYPTTPASCLGPIGTRCARVSPGPALCMANGGMGTAAAFGEALADVAINISSPSDQTIYCGGEQFAGAFYHTTDGKSASITYYLKSNTDCSAVGITLASRTVVDETTRCIVRLPAL